MKPFLGRAKQTQPQPPPATAPCPCGSGLGYGDCCAPILAGEAAPTSEKLMRSRFTAYAVADLDHVFRTWHPRTRPAQVPPTPGINWNILEVLHTEAGGEEDDQGVVEFIARFTLAGKKGAMHESSRFERRAGRWFYVDGDVFE